MTDKELFKLSLDALEESNTDNDTMEFWDRKIKAITALKERLAQPEQELDDIAAILACRDMLDAQPVPPRRTEPPQKKKVWTFWDLSGGDITDAIKAKIKEKNT